MASDRTFYLSGKDYLTRDEAAHYACVSVSQWDTMRRTHGIPEIRWGGKVIFAREDIRRAIEHFRRER